MSQKTPAQKPSAQKTAARKTPAQRNRKPGASRTPSRKGVAIGAAVAAAALLLGVASQFATGGSERPSHDTAAASVSSGPDEGVYPELAKLARRDEGDALAQGRKDAPVVLIEYADFKCSYCGKFARDTEPDLVRKYVDAGVLRIEWRNFPIFGEDSESAARAAWAAGRQGRFWEFHKAAYADPDAKGKGFGKDRLAELARTAGVPDLERFHADRDSAAAREAVRKDQEEAYGLGATSTPSFLVNGRPIAGAQPEEVFTAAVEAAARKAKEQEKAPQTKAPETKAPSGAESARGAKSAESGEAAR
ncbi:DsbA family protein [Streptomyces sp. URMC 123]|uniref:DsbA family protein n=1 Tax=Streptomyces sp. URMC 123 TaxID=3423403 RepID=UPI003F1B026C